MKKVKVLASPNWSKKFFKGKLLWVRNFGEGIVGVIEQRDSDLFLPYIIKNTFDNIIQKTKIPLPTFDKAMHTVDNLVPQVAIASIKDLKLGQSLIVSMHIPNEIPTLFYENEKGDRFIPDLSTDGYPEVPKEFGNQRSRFPNQVTDSLLLAPPSQEDIDACDHPENMHEKDFGIIDSMEGRTCRKCGGYQSKNKGEEWKEQWEPRGHGGSISSCSTFSIELVEAMVKKGVKLDQAILQTSIACEACMNALAHKYGLDWGYPEDSEDYKKAGTLCELCVPLKQDASNPRIFRKAPDIEVAHVVTAKGNKVVYSKNSVQVDIDDLVSEKDYFFHWLTEHVDKSSIYREFPMVEVSNFGFSHKADDPRESYGIERTPHVTCLYGLTNDADFFEIRKLVSSLSPFELKITRPSSFRKPDNEYDVLTYEVESEMLSKLHDDLKARFANEDKYPIYKPHMTVAYVNKGTNKEWENGEHLNKTIKVTQLTFSLKGEKFVMKLGEATASVAKKSNVMKVYKALEPKEKDQKFLEEVKRIYRPIFEGSYRDDTNFSRGTLRSDRKGRPLKEIKKEILQTAADNLKTALTEDLKTKGKELLEKLMK